MQAIRTKYLGASNTRGSRYKAISGSGENVTMYTNNGLTSQQNHRAVAGLLCDKLKWGHNMIGGGLGNDYVWVFTDSNVGA